MNGERADIHEPFTRVPAGLSPGAQEGGGTHPRGSYPDALETTHMTLDHATAAPATAGARALAAALTQFDAAADHSPSIPACARSCASRSASTRSASR